MGSYSKLLYAPQDQQEAIIEKYKVELAQSNTQNGANITQNENIERAKLKEVEVAEKIDIKKATTQT